MKRTIMVVILVVSMLFSCNASHDADINDVNIYNVLICQDGMKNDGTDLSATNKFSLHAIEYVNDTVDSSKTFAFGSAEHILNYQYSVSSSFLSSKYDCYVDENTGLRVCFFSESENIRMIGNTDYGVSTIQYPEEITNGEEYLSWFETVVSETIDIDLSEYNFSCNTTFEDSSIIEWFAVDNENYDQAIQGYSFEYIRRVDDYDTSDKVRVSANSKGDILWISRFASGLDHDYSLNIDEEKIILSIDNAVKDSFSRSFL